MESNSYNREIHCTNVFAKLLEDQAPHISLHKRRMGVIKGMGDMTTLWVGNATEAVGSSVDKDHDDGKPKCNSQSIPRDC
jgi:hypothetical protein